VLRDYPARTSDIFRKLTGYGREALGPMDTGARDALRRRPLEVTRLPTRPGDYAWPPC
jgi:hypothetical protein